VFPVVFSGGGTFYFWWELGVLHHLRVEACEAYYLGVSTGNLANAVHVCEVPFARLLERAETLVAARSATLSEVIGNIRAWLDAVLPADAHVRCTGRLFVALYVFPNTSRVHGSYATRAELIEVLVRSISIPGLVARDLFRPMDHCFDEIGVIDPRRHAVLSVRPRTRVMRMLEVPSTEWALCQYYKGKAYARTLRLRQTHRQNDDGGGDEDDAAGLGLSWWRPDDQRVREVPNNPHVFAARAMWTKWHYGLVAAALQAALAVRRGDAWAVSARRLVWGGLVLEALLSLREHWHWASGGNVVRLSPPPPPRPLLYAYLGSIVGSALGAAAGSRCLRARAPLLLVQLAAAAAARYDTSAGRTRTQAFCAMAAVVCAHAARARVAQQ
jgi:hypothetical protein